MAGTKTTRLPPSDWHERSALEQEMLRLHEGNDMSGVEALLAREPWLASDGIYEAKTWAHAAAACGRLELLKFWLERFPSLRPGRQLKDRWDQPLAFYAVGLNDVDLRRQGDHLSVVRFCIEGGDSPDGNPKAEQSLVQRAVFYDRPAVLEYLIGRGADLSRTLLGKTLLGEAVTRGNESCAALLRSAGVPLEVPPKPKRETKLDLRKSAVKLTTALEKAVARLAKKKGVGPVSAIALAVKPHEGIVMIAFDEGASNGNPWDYKHAEFAFVNFADWYAAHEQSRMRVTGTDGSERSAPPDDFLPDFMAMTVEVLKTLESRNAFANLRTTAGCVLGVHMTLWGRELFWPLTPERR